MRKLCLWFRPWFVVLALTGCSAAQVKQVNQAVQVVQDVQTLAKDVGVVQPVPFSTYQVLKGDTLWGIASRRLPSAFEWPVIWKASRDEVVDPDWIEPGQNLSIPATVADGDVLWSRAYAAQSSPKPAVSHAQALQEK